MAEFYTKKERLITEKEYKKRVRALKGKETTESKKKLIKNLEKELFLAIKRRVPDGRYGIMFSGGIDSSLISYFCRKINPNFICYAVGVEIKGIKSAEDITYAKKAAKSLGLTLKIIKLDVEQAERVIRETVGVLRRGGKKRGKDLINVVNVGVGAVELVAVEMAKKDRVGVLFSGLGSEEIFAGYQRHENAKNINKECWNGLLGMYERDLLRDYSISNSKKIGFRTPFLDEDLVRYSMMVPGRYKIGKEYKKMILREMAAGLRGFPRNISWRKKKAAQYGSKMDKALKKLARLKGFRYKSEYLKKV